MKNLSTEDIDLLYYIKKDIENNICIGDERNKNGYMLPPGIGPFHPVVDILLSYFNSEKLETTLYYNTKTDQSQLTFRKNNNFEHKPSDSSYVSREDLEFARNEGILFLADSVHDVEYMV